MAAWRRLAQIWQLEVTGEAGIDARHFLPGRVQQNGSGWHLRNRNHQMSEGAGQEGGSAAPNTSPGNLSCPGFPPAFGRADEHGRHFSLNLTLHLLEGCSTCEVLQHPVRRGREREDEWAWDWRNEWLSDLEEFMGKIRLHRLWASPDKFLFSFLPSSGKRSRSPCSHLEENTFNKFKALLTGSCPQNLSGI